MRTPNPEPRTEPGIPHLARHTLDYRVVGFLACPICFGASDAPMAQAMNWGVLSLLAITMGVLVSFGVFFLRLARTAAAARLKSRPTSEDASYVGPNFSSAGGHS